MSLDTILNRPALVANSLDADIEKVNVVRRISNHMKGLYHATANSIRAVGVVSLATLVLGVVAEAGTYSGGTGEPNNPYLISTAADMNEIGAHPDDLDKHFKLMTDISLLDYTGEEFTIIGRDDELAFAGVFDGNDHRISNFTYNSTDKDWIGLFRFVNGENAEIKNLGLIHAEVDARTEPRTAVGLLVGCNSGRITNCYVEEGNVTAYRVVGGLVGWNDGTITNCCVNSSRIIGNNSVGGLVGWNYGTITNSYAAGCVTEDEEVIGGLVGGNFGTVIGCYATNNVTGNDSVGGLVGRNSKFSIITNCYATGSIIGETSVGGLTGTNWGGTIIHSYATGSVIGDSTVGGLAGWNGHSSEITKCYATGSVTGETLLGGLVGWNYGDGKITNSYATGSVTGNDYVGGLVGWNYKDGKITKCYATGGIEGTKMHIGGLLGSNTSECGRNYECKYGIINHSYWDTETSKQNTSDGGTGKTTTQMHQQLTFQDWDFINVWDIGENQNYPYLRVHSAGDLNHDFYVNMLDFAVLADKWLRDNEE